MHTKIKTYVLAMGFAVLAFGGVSFAQPNQVMAASSVNDLGYPIPITETWEVIQGYYSTCHLETPPRECSHQNYALFDLTKVVNGVANDEATKNAPVIAVFDGVVGAPYAIYSRGQFQGYRVILTADDGTKASYTHINQNLLVPANTRVNKGRKIATIYPEYFGGRVHLDFGITLKNNSNYNVINYGELKFPLNPTTAYTCRSNIPSQYCGARLTNNPKPKDLARLGAIASKPNAITPVYRFFNVADNTHVWTAGPGERNQLSNNPNWSLEGIAFYADSAASELTGKTEFYRSYNPADPSKGFFIGTKGTAPSGWVEEGIVFYGTALPIPGRTTTLYRLRNVSTGKYFVTTDVNENNALKSGGWTSMTSLYVHSSSTCHNQICPVFVLWNSKENRHFTSSNMNGEIMPMLRTSSDWSFGKVGFYAFESAGPKNNRVVMYRFSNPAKNNYYFSTNATPKSGWTRDGGAFYVNPNATDGVMVREHTNIMGKLYYGTEKLDDPNIGGWLRTGVRFRALASYR